MIFFIIPWFFVVCVWRLFVLRGFDLREGLLAANIVGAVMTLFSTEVLTSFHQLRFSTVFLFWSAALLAIIFILSRQPRSFVLIFPSIVFSRLEKVLLGCLIFIFVVTGVIALLAPPNTWDALTYHMARVMHWQMDQGVMNYPTNNIRQLVYFPFAEYMILQAQILSGSDRFATVVQWGAFWMSACGVSLLAGVLGASRLGQIFSALFVATLPMAILQSTSTQNDLIAGFWIVSAAYFALQGVFQKRWDMMILSASGFGVAALTKGVGLIFSAAFIISVVLCFKFKWKEKAGFVGLMLLALTVCCAPFCGRLLQISSSPAKAMALGGDVAAERFGLAEFISSSVKNVAMEVALPFDGWNRAVEKGVAALHKKIGVGMKDPQLSNGHDFGVSYSIDEDVAPNPLHMFLVLIAGVAFFFIGRKSSRVWFLWMALIIGMAIFCVTVKWQPWITRFHVTFFLLAAPLVVFVLEKWWPKTILILVLGVLFLTSLHALTLNNTRRIFSKESMFHYTRDQMYFSRWRGADVLYQSVLGGIKSTGCSDVGIMIGGDSWEYPFWALSSGKTRFEHINVDTGTEKFPYPMGAFMPCSIIKEAPQEDPTMVYGKQVFFRVLKGYWTVYIRFDHMPSEFQAQILKQLKEQ